MGKLEDSLKKLQGEANGSLVKTPEIRPKGRRGGSRGGGRPIKESTLAAKGIASYVDGHISSEHLIQVTDPKTGKVTMVKKTRVVLALEKLWALGMKGEGDADALNKWLDRALGKPKQVLAGDGDRPVFQLQINIANILNKAYGTDDHPRGN